VREARAANEHSHKAHPQSSRPDLRAGLAHGRWVGAGEGTWTKAAPRRRPGTPESQTSRMKESYLGSMSLEREKEREESGGGGGPRCLVARGVVPGLHVRKEVSGEAPHACTSLHGVVRSCEQRAFCVGKKKREAHTEPASTNLLVWRKRFGRNNAIRFEKKRRHSCSSIPEMLKKSSSTASLIRIKSSTHVQRCT